jgi:hypothetical protein
MPICYRTEKSEEFSENSIDWWVKASHRSENHGPIPANRRQYGIRTSDGKGANRERQERYAIKAEEMR